MLLSLNDDETTMRYLARFFLAAWFCFFVLTFVSSDFEFLKATVDTIIYAFPLLILWYIAIRVFDKK